MEMHYYICITARKEVVKRLYPLRLDPYQHNTHNSVHNTVSNTNELKEKT